MTESPTKPTFTTDDIKRFRENLKDEVDGAALYRLLSAAEKDPHLKEVYSRLAISEDRHLLLWQNKLREAGSVVPAYRPSFRVRMLGWLARRFGTQAVAPIVTRMEVAAKTMYDSQPEAVAENLPADERSHARLFREISKTGKAAEEGVNIARLEGRHRGGGNALRAAVLGINDGLVSTLSLVMGVAGASPGRQVVFLSGVAGLLAGSLAMALGEWISVHSSIESFQRQLRIEREELEMMPEEEEAELTLIYQAKGFTLDEARTAAKRILNDPVTALDTLAREELGMSEGEAGNAMVAAITSFLLFSAGAALPVLPWLFVGGATGMILSAILAGLGLFGAGAITTLFTGRGVTFSGTRMLVFGLTAAAITFGIGRLIGVSTGV
jgi:vacuolar iron transporter family protein